MHQRIWLLMLVIAPLLATAQTQQVDSLLKTLETEKADSNLAKTYRKIAEYYSDNNPGKAIEYYERSLEAAKRIDRKLLVANNYYSIGFAYLLKGDYDKSLENYLLSVRVYEEMKDTFRLSNALMSIGNVYVQINNGPKTREYYARAQKLIEAIRDSAQLGSLFMERGVQYDQAKQYDTSMYFHRKALAIGVALKDDYFISNALSNIALTYKHQQKNAEALVVLDSVLRMFTRLQVPADNFAAVYNNIAATHAQAGNYAQAETAFATSIKYGEEIGAASIVMENYRNMADMYEQMKDYRRENLYLKKYYSLKDSLFTADKKNQLTQLEADYHLEQKNSVIVKQEAEVEKQRNQRNLFIIIAIAAALVLSTLAIFYSRIRKKNQLLQEKNTEINQQKDELATLNHVKDRLFSIISHDLRNPLVTLRSYLSLSDSSAIPEEKKQEFRTQTIRAVSQTSDMLDNLLAWANMQIKNTAVPITPVDITDCVLDVEHHVQAQAQQKRVDIVKNMEHLTAPGDQNIISIALRNLLTNAIKFTGPGKKVYIEVEKRDNHIHISVKDEGIGMSPEQLDKIRSNQASSTTGTGGEKGSGLGIFLVRELLEKIKGQLLVNSTEGVGSTFTIQLPAL